MCINSHVSIPALSLEWIGNTICHFHHENEWTNYTKPPSTEKDHITRTKISKMYFLFDVHNHGFTFSEGGGTKNSCYKDGFLTLLLIFSLGMFFTIISIHFAVSLTKRKSISRKPPQYHHLNMLENTNCCKSSPSLPSFVQRCNQVK